MIVATQDSTSFPLIAACTIVATVGLLAAVDRSAAADSVQRTKIEFSRDVRPILSDRCFQCHGPDEKARRASLRLDRREDAQRVLSIGDDGKSELQRRITGAAADRMPPLTSKLALTSDEIDTLVRWVRHGAPYSRHWSFLPLTATAVPSVNDTSWPRNAIDRFVLARLERAGLRPSPEAGKERLIRRVTFDLTGLPPTLPEIDDFLADESQHAYEKLVDRLLAKTEYGERMAVDWLDLARYADSYGYQVDRDRFVWPWRDWVIDAFNRNQPYDEFLTWQLAGDLIPNSTDEQTLATAFNRLHPQKVEGGSVPEEFRVEYVADRTQTVATAVLGLTLQCARCHDHKYDPFTQKEYYQLFAFFNQIDEAGLYSYFTPSVPTPTLLLTDADTRAKIDDVERRIVQKEKALETERRRRHAAFDSWLDTRPAHAAVPGRIAHLDFENGKNGANRSVAGKVGTAVQLSGDDGINLKVGNFRRYDPFSVALWMSTPDRKDRAVVFHRSRAWTDAASRGYQLLIENGRLSASLIHFWPGNAIRVRTRKSIPTNEWLHVAVTYDGSSRAAGLQLFLNGRPTACDIVRDGLRKNITGGGGDNITIGARFRDRGFTKGLVDEFKVYERQLTPIEVAQLHDGTSLTEALSRPHTRLAPSERAALFEHYLATSDSVYRERLASLRAVRIERSQLVDGIPELMVMRELHEPRKTFLLERGAYDAPHEPVVAATPAVLPTFPAEQAGNRLGLTRWLTDPAHPLTARVAVNRFWNQCFGQGLVRTPEDFGSQGEPPTHPALLDWLAGDFIEHGWDVKRLLKILVTSAAYRQSSAVSRDLIERDPENRLLGRGPTHRLPAEMIRDNALAVSGLLVRKTGGPPVRPYEVTASFKPMPRDKGEGLYRRSVYTFWKRTGPAPAMMTFDASKRDVCVVKRERTSTPLQALVVLNGPQFVEAARVLGQRLVAEHGDDVESLIDELFRLLTSRRPSEQERLILRQLYLEQLSYFRENEARADEFLKTGDAPRDSTLAAPRLAAAGVLASALMNFDECMVKR